MFPTCSSWLLEFHCLILFFLSDGHFCTKQINEPIYYLREARAHSLGSDNYEIFLV